MRRFANLKAQALLLTLLAGLFLTSCGDSSDDDGPGDVLEGISGQVTATIDGESFTSFLALGADDEAGSGFTATSADYSITIVFTQTLTAGTYTIVTNSEEDPDDVIVSLTRFQGNGAFQTFTGTTGSVTLTSVNTTSQTISGTFSFTATSIGQAESSTLSVTNGTFTNVSYVIPEDEGDGV